MLFQSRIDEMNSWVLRVGGDDWITYEFLNCLRDSATLFSDDREEVVYNLDLGKRGPR